MLGRETVRSDLHASSSGPISKEVAINVLAVVSEDNRLWTIAAPRDAMRAVGNDDASETGHARAMA